MKMVVFVLECLIDCVQKRCKLFRSLVSRLFFIMTYHKDKCVNIYFELCYDFSMFLSVKETRELMCKLFSHPLNRDDPHA